MIMKQCCTDRNGNPKRKYRSQEEAERAAQMRRDVGVGIKVYPCNQGDGWHLTSRHAVLPARPKNVMTREERVLFTRLPRNPLVDSMNGEVVTQLKDCARRDTLQLLEEKIAGFRQETEEKTEAVRRLRGQIVALKHELESAERELKASQRNLSNARYEYERAKKPV